MYVLKQQAENSQEKHHPLHVRGLRLGSVCTPWTSTSQCELESTSTEERSVRVSGRGDGQT